LEIICFFSGYEGCWKAIAKGEMEGQCAIGAFHFENHLLLAITYLFYDAFLGSFGMELDVKFDWREFQIEKMKVIRKVITTAHFFALKTLIAYYSVQKGAKHSPKAEEFELFFEEMIAKHLNTNSGDSNQPSGSKKGIDEFKEIITKIEKLLSLSRAELVQRAKNCGVTTKANMSILTATILKKEGLEQINPLDYKKSEIEDCIKKMKSKPLVALLYLFGVVSCPKGGEEVLRKAILSLFDVDTTTQQEKTILCLYTFSKFSFISFLLYKAYRTANFELYILCLKKSLKLFEITAKTHYWWITTRQLFDVNYRFSDFHMEIWKNLWVIESSTKNTNLAIDEKNEFVNKFLKEKLRSVNLEKLNWLAKNYNYLAVLDDIWGQMFRRSQKKIEKSKGIDFKNLDLVMQDETNIIIPKPLLEYYNMPVDADKIDKELSKIKEDLKWDSLLDNEEQEFEEQQEEDVDFSCSE